MTERPEITGSITALWMPDETKSKRGQPTSAAESAHTLLDLAVEVFKHFAHLGTDGEDRRQDGDRDTGDDKAVLDQLP